ncbi:MAG TPA: TolC family protein [Bryobacteraceae bacterium]|jgi:outer membrane protein TolC|nr:TolC family protein [Bryobacteraceae bacterium]
MPKWTRIITLACLAAALRAEVHTMKLQQAVDRALEQNPEIAMARLDELKAQAAVRVQKDPFAPHLYIGSGLAYTDGFPMSIEGAAPSIVQGRVSEVLFNRQQSYAVARTKEEARGAGISASAKQDEIAFRTAALFLDAERAARAGEMARKEVESSQKVLSTIQNRVQEGRELPIEAKRGELNLARARQLADSLDADRETAETSLAIVLGYGAEDRVRPSSEERPVPPLPASEEAAVESALQSSKELRGLQSQIAAKGLEERSAKAARLPHADLVAQYGLFATFNHYQDYFLRYQPNNGEIGVSFQLPLLPGPGAAAAAAEANADAARLTIQLAHTRNQITANTRQCYREVRKAEAQRDVARLDLDVAREQVSVNLAMLEEGRILLSQVEESRIAESGKWIAFYDAQYAVERARWTLARQTGDLLAAFK